MRFSVRFPCSVAAVLLMSAGLFQTTVRGQDTPPAGKKGAAAGAAEKAPNIKEWDDLIARRKKILKDMEKWEAEFRSADQAGKQAIAATAQKAVAELQQEIQPKIIKLAPEAYKKNPKDVVAGDILAQMRFMENKYNEVVAIQQSLKGAEGVPPHLLTMAGISQFALHDFDKAEATLTEAQKTDQQLFPQLGVAFFRSCADYIKFWAEEQEIRAKEAKADDLPRVLFKTTKGDITLELFENEAPNTVANFISLVEAGKYDGIAFHRVIPNFMAQGGDPNTLDDDPANDGAGGPGYTIACECYREDARKHFQGTLSMAHAGKDTGGSQFFITHLPTAHLNPNVERQSGHTVFGRVLKGMDVALSLEIGDKIVSAKVIRKREHEYVPKKIGPKLPALKKVPAKQD
jgi:cyclophilin family peptidyl-prolyl cis-trans isomerase